MSKVADMIIECDEKAYEILKKLGEPTPDQISELGQKIFDEKLRELSPKIPVRFLASLNRYVHDRIETGGFLRAVLENNLFEAMSRADDDAKVALHDIVKYIYNDIRGDCWGSPEKVEAWLENNKET